MQRRHNMLLQQRRTRERQKRRRRERLPTSLPLWTARIRKLVRERWRRCAGVHDRHIMPVGSKCIVSFLDLAKIINIHETEFREFALLHKSAMFALAKASCLLDPFAARDGVMFFLGEFPLLGVGIRLVLL